MAGDIGEVYDLQADDYSRYGDERFAWLYIEKPAYDRYVSDCYRSDAKILDLGCGNGLVARHFIAHGVDPQNITGVDASSGQVEQARRLTPGVTFLESSAEAFDIEPGSMDLVVTNTVLHHLDNQQLEEMLTRIYRVLKPGGSYFFVDIDPDHSEEGRDPANVDRWTKVKTPWGTEVPFFNRDPGDLMDALDRHGFDKVSGWPLTVDPAGEIMPDEYSRYSGRPSRMAARFEKVPELTRIYRMNDVQIPDLSPTKEQIIQRGLAKKYFDAWETKSTAGIRDIFTEDAVYDEKPGAEEPIVGLEEIIKYWEQNPVSQENIALSYVVVGYSKDKKSIWLEFQAGFDVRGEHVEVSGALQLTTDKKVRRITKLTEYFTSTKAPLQS